MNGFWIYSKKMALKAPSLGIQLKPYFLFLSTLIFPKWDFAPILISFTLNSINSCFTCVPLGIPLTSYQQSKFRTWDHFPSMLFGCNDNGTVFLICQTTCGVAILSLFSRYFGICKIFSHQKLQYLIHSLSTHDDKICSLDCKSSSSIFRGNNVLQSIYVPIIICNRFHQKWGYEFP